MLRGTSASATKWEPLESGAGTPESPETKRGTATVEWGFSYLKLDFLHTAAMPGGVRHDPSISRGEALHRMMAAVRAAVGDDIFILGCGAPLGPCIGHVDGMRVSADAATDGVMAVAAREGAEPSGFAYLQEFVG